MYVHLPTQMRMQTSVHIRILLGSTFGSQSCKVRITSNNRTKEEPWVNDKHLGHKDVIRTTVQPLRNTKDIRVAGLRT